MISCKTFPVAIGLLVLTATQCLAVCEEALIKDNVSRFSSLEEKLVLISSLDASLYSRTKQNFDGSIQFPVGKVPKRAVMERIRSGKLFRVIFDAQPGQCEPAGCGSTYAFSKRGSALHSASYRVYYVQATRTWVI
jgi:hypothetical protein